MNFPFEVDGSENSSQTLRGQPVYCHALSPSRRRTRIRSFSSSYAIAVIREDPGSSIHSIIVRFLPATALSLQSRPASPSDAVAIGRVAGRRRGARELDGG